MRVISLGLAQPAYDYVLKCSHTFNLLDARSAISVTERPSYIFRVRTMARECAKGYVKQRETLGYPMIKDPELRDQIKFGSGKGGRIMRDLLLEIGLEEVPAKFMPPALAELKQMAETQLQEQRIAYDEL